MQKIILTIRPYRCDQVDLNNKAKAPDVERQSYTHAQKMRAACTYGFGRIHGLGNAVWSKNPFSKKWHGNPSVSEVVSTYMVSLRWRKVCAGERPTSAKAITVVHM